MAITLIAHTEVGSGGAATISFTSIAGTYDDLWLVTSLRQAGSFANGDTTIRLNSDSATNYSYTRIQASGSTAATLRASSQAQLMVGDDPALTGTASTFSNNSIYIPNYKNTSYNKQLIVENCREANSTTAYFMAMFAGLWRNTAAITSITLTPERGSYEQYSQATLYGITKA